MTATAREINCFVEDVLEFGRCAELQLVRAMEALAAGDRARADAVVALDRELKARRLELERRAVWLATGLLPSPEDLRRLFAAVFVLGDADRAAEAAGAIAELARDGAGGDHLGLLPALADRAVALLNDALDAVAEDDRCRAARVRAGLREVEHLHGRARDRFQAELCGWPSEAVATDALLDVAGELLRAGRAAASIAGRLIVEDPRTLSAA